MPDIRDSAPPLWRERRDILERAKATRLERMHLARG
jgi:hypothetical protein